MARLALIHRPRGARAASCGTTWATCLREVTFFDPAMTGWPTDADLLVDEHAYAVLVEIVCGMRSPVIGETEVQAQFKAFLASLDPMQHGPLRQLGQRVLCDAKRIRSLHLQGIGAHSYGRLALRYVTANHVAIVGAGALAREVLSRMHRQMHADVWSRRIDPDPLLHECRLERYQLADAQTGRARTTTAAAAVIAAPVDAAHLNDILACYPQLTEVIDLRAADESSPIPYRVPHITLAMLLADAGATTRSGAAAIAAARAEIQALARAYLSREELHPAGWEDICA